MARHGRVFAALTVALTVAALGAPGTALAVKEREPLNAFPPCPGSATVGKVVIKDLAKGGVKVKIKVTNGPPNGNISFLWVPMNAPKSCQDFSGGNTDLGGLALDASGKGRLVVVLPGGNPYPGKYVRIDGDGTPAATAVFSNIFQ